VAWELIRLGYSDVYALDGGFRAWDKKDLPLEDK
jgi:3-mercaptopyruvate sulfurtransferase SseA